MAFALIDQVWMPPPTQRYEKFNPITADFTYIRWLGDRKGIGEKTKSWDHVIVDRRTELAEWIEIVGKIHNRRIQISAYANNRYAGTVRPRLSPSKSTPHNGCNGFSRVLFVGLVRVVLPNRFNTYA